MSEFIDQFSNLPQVIDLGGDKYFMGPQKPIELGFKSRKNYLDSFGSDRETEYLLRKYMFYSLEDKRKLKFDSPEDKSKLINILKKRAKQLEGSKEFTSSLLKNTIIQRSFNNIQKLIQQLEGPDYKGVELPKLSNIDILPCTKAKKYIKQIPDDAKFQLILEIAWYLLHPDMVPSKVECDWAKLIKQLDTLRIGSIAAEIRKVEQEKGIKPTDEALNYFKKINLENAVKAPTIQNARDKVIKMATELQGQNSNNKIKERLKTILNILAMKKYLANTIQENEDGLKIIDNSVTNSIKRSMPTNPMAGGAAAKTLDKPLGIAMKPLFDYFKSVYDPIYSILESSMTTNLNGSEKTTNVIIPQLTTLLHICNNLNPTEDTYGIYRITNVDATAITFINDMLSATQNHLGKYQDDAQKNIFNEQLFKLPKVRLSSLVNKILNANVYKDPDELPYIQFFTVGGNIELMSKEKFMDPKNPEMTEQVFNAVNEFFNKDDLYILCTKSQNKSEDIPMNMYQINYDSIDVGDKGIKIDNIPGNFFNSIKNKGPVFHLEKLVTILPYVVYNDAELALSIFIAFKELLPK
jgi:hypothetical protein